MKRFLAMVLTLALLCLPVSAQTTLVMTDFEYADLRSGGINDTFVFGAYENNGATYKMGLLTEDGEQSRVAWTADGWNALFAPSEWMVTIHGDAGMLCPYADAHRDSTLCPYRDVALVTLTHRETGVVLRERYMYSQKKTVTSGGSLHLCSSNYNYVSPETLRWSGNGARVALCNEQGLWGVYDAQTDAMLTDFVYADMSAVYGDYVKVSDGAAWGRLDLSGATDTAYVYKAAKDFSVTEELRSLGNKQYCVFNADNEPISVVYTLSVTSVTYAPEAYTVMCVYTDGTKALLDLAGNTVASFDTLQKVRYLNRACYAVEQYTARDTLVGVALAQVTDAVKPNDTVVKGDVNLDGVCDSTDVRLILLNTVDIHSFTDRQKAAADLAEDGVVNSEDARALIVTL